MPILIKRFGVGPEIIFNKLPGEANAANPQNKLYEAWIQKFLRMKAQRCADARWQLVFLLDLVNSR